MKATREVDYQLHIHYAGVGSYLVTGGTTKGREWLRDNAPRISQWADGEHLMLSREEMAPLLLGAVRDLHRVSIT